MTNNNYVQLNAPPAKLEDLGLTYINQYMEQMGGLPALGAKPGGNWNQTGFDITSFLVRMRKRTKYIPLIDVGVMQDDKIPTQYILYVR